MFGAGNVVLDILIWSLFSNLIIDLCSLVFMMSKASVNEWLMVDGLDVNKADC